MAMTRKEFLTLSGKAALAAQAARLGFFGFLNEPPGFARDVLGSPGLKKIHA